MKYLLFTALSMYSLLASAQDNLASAPNASAQDAQYDYSQDLDIARVVRINTASHPGNECGPLKARMEYLDSKGIAHKLEYTRLGEDCEKG